MLAPLPGVYRGPDAQHMDVPEHRRGDDLGIGRVDDRGVDSRDDVDVIAGGDVPAHSLLLVGRERERHVTLWDRQEGGRRVGDLVRCGNDHVGRYRLASKNLHLRRGAGDVGDPCQDRRRRRVGRQSGQRQGIAADDLSRFDIPRGDDHDHASGHRVRSDPPEYEHTHEGDQREYEAESEERCAAAHAAWSEGTGFGADHGLAGLITARRS